MSKVTKILALLITTMILAISAGAVFAQDAGMDAGAMVDAATPPAAGGMEFDPSAVLGAIQSGKWLWAFGALLVLAVKFLRPWFAKRVAWFGTSLGGKTFAFACAFLLTLGDALGQGKGLSMAMLGTTFTLAWVAAGQNEHAKDAATAMKAKE